MVYTYDWTQVNLKWWVFKVYWIKRNKKYNNKTLVQMVYICIGAVKA